MPAANSSTGLRDRGVFVEPAEGAGLEEDAELVALGWKFASLRRRGCISRAVTFADFVAVVAFVRSEVDLERE